MDEIAVRARAKEIMGREWRIGAESIPDDARLNIFPAWDSLGHIGMILALADEFDLQLDAESVQTLVDLDSIVAHVRVAKGL